MNPFAWLQRIPAPIRKLLGMGARKVAEAGVDALQRHADSPAPKPLDVGERVRRVDLTDLGRRRGFVDVEAPTDPAYDDEHPTRPDLELPPAKRRRQ